MKKFGVIFQYEIMNYIKNKSFMISTIVIAVLAAVILFLPSVFDMSGILGINKDDTDDTADNTEITDVIIILSLIHIWIIKELYILIWLSSIQHGDTEEIIKGMPEVLKNLMIDLHRC